MGWLFRSNAEQKAYKEERDRKQRIKDKLKSEEDQARHRGRLVYLEKEARKGGGRGGGFFDGLGGFMAGGVKDMARNASSHSSIGGSGPMYSSGSGRGGLGFNPITGETYSRKKRHKRK
jgi:hypothetical protein